MNKARVAMTDAEIDAAIARAAEAGDQMLVEEAKYNRALDVLALRLRNGRRVLFPREDLEGLRGAPAAKVARVEVLAGVGLHWEDLNVDLYAPALLEGIYGSKRWMREIGRRGGEVRSARKAKAARRNGAKGGRPQRVTATA
jgi:Protein of unknown function (DUF2442)